MDSPDAELTKYSTVKEAKFYERVKEDNVVCLTCERRCRIPEGSKGFCNTRMNIQGIIDLRKSHREEAFLPFSSWYSSSHHRDMELQFHLPLVSELRHI
jgi:uncharacterized Fe-S radical SAM superfamily protein PflX